MLSGSAPQPSWATRLDPRARLLVIAILMVVALFARRGPQFLGLAAILLGLSLLARVRLGPVLRGLGALAVLILTTFLLQLLLAPGEPLVRWGPLRISSAGLRLGAILAGRLILLAALSALLGALTSPLELAGAIAGLLRPSARLGFPVRRVALVLGIALRFVPELQQEAGRIFRAQRARGSLPVPPWRHPQRLLAVLIPLFLGTLRRAERLAEALEARCYREDYPHSKTPAPLSRRDLLALGAALALALGLLRL